MNAERDFGVLAIFMPHGYCYQWTPLLVWAHAIADGLIAAAYFSIPVALVYFVRKRRDIEFGWMLVCFAMFIVACGTTHVLEIWNIWNADYWAAAWVKALTAAVSIMTAILLVRLLPTALTLPSTGELRRLNSVLENEVANRRRAEEDVHRLNAQLERRVAERTAQLHALNEDLQRQVAERIHTAEELRASSRELSEMKTALDEHAIVAITNPQGKITFVNDKFCAISKYAREELIGQDHRIINSGYHSKEFIRELWTTIARGQVWRGEIQNRAKDGSLYWVATTIVPFLDDAGKPRQYVAIRADITARKQAEAGLATSLKELSEMKTALDEHAIVAITNPQGKITFVNDKFCAISKYAREELIGQDHRIINSGYHSKEFIRELWTTIGRGQVWRGEIQNRAKDGSRYWVATTIVPFLDDAGKPRQYVAIRADITERKRAEGEITLLNAELERRVAERTSQLESANRELEAFSYSVSHDLRAPLRGIDGFARILQEDCAALLDDEGRRALAIICSESKRMGQLIDDLLGFSRMSRKELEATVVDMAELAQSVFDGLLTETVKHAPEFVLKPLPKVLGDRATLRQVLVNLLGNAVKFTAHQANPVIELGAVSEGGVATFYVKDNGVGFDEKYRAKLFGVFQRLHSEDEFEGTGVGLALVQRIVHRHGGKVWAEGRLGAGATFSFSLPEATETIL
jgi:PAS domain S-box-containing protein